MAVLVDKDYVDKMFELLVAKTTLVSKAVDKIYIATAGPGNAARSRNNGYFSYLCDSEDVDPTKIVTSDYAGTSFRFAFTGGMVHGTNSSYNNSTMIQAVHIRHNSGVFFGQALFVYSNDSGKSDTNNQSMSGYGNAGYDYYDIMGDPEGHTPSVESVTLYGDSFLADEDGNKTLQLSLLNVDKVSGTFNVDVVVEDNAAFEGSLSFSEVEGVEFSCGSFVLNNGVNAATVTVTATNKIDATDVWVMAGRESDSFTLTVIRPYATGMELLKDNSTLEKLELTLDENNKASGTFTVSITMDTSGAIYRDSLAFTQVDGVDFNYTIPSSNEIEVTVNATQAMGPTTITVTAIGENGNLLPSSFELSVLEHVEPN